METFDKTRFVIPSDIGLCLLDCKKAFDNLTLQEKLYAHYLSRASWFGSLICLIQTSSEAPGIYLLLSKLFGQEDQSPAELQALAEKLGQVSAEEFNAFLVYAAAFLANMGNYKSFGDSKFIPDLPQEKFEAIVKYSKAFERQPDLLQDLWQKVSCRMYSLTSREQTLGLADKGITTYFSYNCEVSDAELAQEFLNSKDLSAYNTRLFKYKDADGQFVYEIRLASINTAGSSLPVLGSHQFVPKDGRPAVTFLVTRGDYSSLLGQVVENLQKAQKYAANDCERHMLAGYIESFTEGSIPSHKEGSRHWIRNKGPVVETYIGFIESYRDPFGVRGEFEGFVAIVNKEMSAKLTELVNNAEQFLPLLPWPSSYEKDKFQRPDFTSLDVLTFGSSGIPAGINIPNYDDIRQTEGFKNVSLGNVLSSGYKDTKVTFLKDADVELFTNLKLPSFEVQVGLHELLGHGSGKLFQQDEDGKFNFDVENTKHIITGEKITSWYKPGETWTSQFQATAASYEECRAECVGIYLCLSSQILSIFGHHGQKADDIIYINWLNMVRAGLCSLEFYSADTQTWGQAHMQARYVILRVLLNAGEDLVTIKKIIGKDGQPDIVITIDRSKINSVGKAAIGEFLKKLQVYKSTADHVGGRELYARYSAVNDSDEPHFLSLRNIVLKRKQPRKMFVQCNTTCSDDNTVTLKEYECSTHGLIQSFVERFSSADQIESDLLKLWNNDEKYFVLN